MFHITEQPASVSLEITFISSTSMESAHILYDNYSHAIIANHAFHTRSKYPEFSIHFYLFLNDHFYCHYRIEVYYVSNKNIMGLV